MIERQAAEGSADFRAAEHDRDFLARKVSASIRRITSLVRGVSSDGLSIARLPAASAVASGMNVSANG